MRRATPRAQLLPVAVVAHGPHRGGLAPDDEVDVPCRARALATDRGGGCSPSSNDGALLHEPHVRPGRRRRAPRAPPASRRRSAPMRRYAVAAREGHGDRAGAQDARPRACAARARARSGSATARFAATSTRPTRMGPPTSASCVSSGHLVDGRRVVPGEEQRVDQLARREGRGEDEGSRPAARRRPPVEPAEQRRCARPGSAQTTSTKKKQMGAGKPLKVWSIFCSQKKPKTFIVMPGDPAEEQRRAGRSAGASPASSGTHATKARGQTSMPAKASQ